jgi:hypothetical protein
MKRIIVSSLVVLFGAIVILGGISKLGDSTVRCGGRLMSSGDECVSTSTTGSETGRKTVEEQQKSDQAGNWVVMGVGALMVVFGTKSLVTGIRNRRKKPAENAVAGQPYPQQVPGWQQQQPVPGQQAPGWNQQPPWGPPPRQ